MLTRKYTTEMMHAFSKKPSSKGETHDLQNALLYPNIYIEDIIMLRIYFVGSDSTQQVHTGSQQPAHRQALRQSAGQTTRCVSRHFIIAQNHMI